MMARRKFQTFEELLAETSTEWTLHPGMRLLVSYEPGMAPRDRLEFRLTPEQVAVLNPKPRERLVARVSKGRIIVERPKAKKRAHRG